MGKVDQTSFKTKLPVNYSDAKSISDTAKTYDNGFLNTNLGQNIKDNYNNVVKSPNEKNASKYVHSLSEAAATEAGGLSAEDAEKVKAAATTALQGAGVSDSNIKKAIEEGFTSTAYTSWSPL